METEKFYRTKDLPFAGVLMHEGKKLMGINKVGRVCLFLFYDKLACEKLEQRYAFGEVYVNARNYHEILKRLKQLVHN